MKYLKFDNHRYSSLVEIVFKRYILKKGIIYLILWFLYDLSNKYYYSRIYEIIFPLILTFRIRLFISVEYNLFCINEPAPSIAFIVNMCRII